jgi:hypothetical protein
MPHAIRKNGNNPVLFIYALRKEFITAYPLQVMVFLHGIYFHIKLFVTHLVLLDSFAGNEV